MSHRSTVLGATLAMAVSGLAWAGQPPSASLVTGRVSSVEASERSVTIETAEGPLTFRLEADSPIAAYAGPADFSSIAPGDRIRVELTGDPRTAHRLDVFPEGPEDGASSIASTRRRFGTPSSRRLLGGMGLATLAVALFFRARRPVTI